MEPLARPCWWFPKAGAGPDMRGCSCDHRGDAPVACSVRNTDPDTAMPVDPQLRSLNIDVPAQPDVLVKLSLLLADDDVDLPTLGRLVESDMALAAAVMKA